MKIVPISRKDLSDRPGVVIYLFSFEFLDGYLHNSLPASVKSFRIIRHIFRVYSFKPITFLVAFFFRNVYSLSHSSENGRFGRFPKAPPTAKSRRF